MAKVDRIKITALECASRIHRKPGTAVRIVLDDAELFEAWLKGDETKVVTMLLDRSSAG